MVASSSCAGDSESCAKASFESSSSVAAFSSSSSSSHHHHHHGPGDTSSKFSSSSSSTDTTTSRNSCDRGLAIVNNVPAVTNANKPHKAHDEAWASVRTLRSKVGNIGISHFKLLKKVGHGDIGTVFLTQLRGSNCFFAMKVMDKEALTQRKKIQRVHREREILEFLDHPFLPTLYAHFEAEQLSCLVMDFCSGGDLHAMRQKQPGKRFGLKAARFYAAEVLLALEYLHMLGIVYRDLKPENVLVREDGHIMLTDFDLSLKCDVKPKLMKCPLSSSMSSSSGRFGLLRSFSVSSSISLSSTQGSSVNCTLPSACTIHPFLSCLPVAANIAKKAQQAPKQQKSLISMLFSKQSGLSTRLKATKADTGMNDFISEQGKLGKQIGCTREEKVSDEVSKSTEAKVAVTSVVENVSKACKSELPKIDEAVQETPNEYTNDGSSSLELIAEPTQARSMSFVGTHEYLSPEMIAGQGHGSAVDWWTFGIFLFELLYGKTPFKGSGNEQTLMNIIKQQLRFPEWGHVDVGESAKSLIQGLLEKDPKKRLGSIKGAAEIKQHPFFRGVNWALIRSSEPPEVPNFSKTKHQQHETTKVFSRTTSTRNVSHFDYF